jgi:V/A-type H+-transporting ATPase subunit I
MNMRPVPARWFELLTTHEDLTLALGTLAATGCIELEIHSDVYPAIGFQDLQQRMQEYDRLVRHYQPYWPLIEEPPAITSGSPGAVLDAALRRLLAWERVARPLIRRLESLSGEWTDLRLTAAMLRNATDEAFDYSLLSGPGMLLAVRLYIMPTGARIGQLPDHILGAGVSTDIGQFLLLVGPADELDGLGAELTAIRARAVQLPRALPGARLPALREVERRKTVISKEIQRLHEAINALAVPHDLAGALGDIARLDWLLSHVTSLPVSENFAWVTGWTSDPGDVVLTAALQRNQVDAVIHFPQPPRGIEAPMVMRNPPWARPFELFARLLGTPDRDEADPSRLLAVLVPLLFGYMFGDVGHGLVLLVAGLLLRRRWPVVRILIANGAAALLFGLVFGSVFGREDVIPALWVHPLAQPLPVLLVPLAGGVVILVLGLMLNAVEAYWRGELRAWSQVEAAIPVLYLAIIAGFFTPVAAWIAAAAGIWYFTGSLLQSHAPLRSALFNATGALLENILQLLVNTVSFLRVGAFALAHGGLSAVFIIMAAATDNPVAGFSVMLAGNLIVIMLEGLVVTIQTTRLVLFEFFIRFLRAGGRMFRPLAAPTTQFGSRSTA